MSELRPAALLALVALVLAPPCAGAWDGVPLPAEPGPGHCNAEGTTLSLSNAALEWELAARGTSLGRARLQNRYTGHVALLDGGLARLTLADGSVIDTDEFRLAAAPTCNALTADPAAARVADRRGGIELHVVLRSASGTLELDYRARLRDGTTYVRELFEWRSQTDVPVRKVQLLDLAAPGADVAGTAQGSPIVARDQFYGVEHPMADADVALGRARVIVRRVLPLRGGVPARYSTVLGVTGAESPRRGFAAYLENERAHPFRPFLHYNSWYDIGYFSRYTEDEALAVVARYGEELVRRRGATLDSFLFDDGWDETDRLWQFHAGFPDGLARLRAATAAIGAAPGLWLSPWGGYGPPREARLATARRDGYEVDAQGLALSGPRYYALFHDTVLDLVRGQGVNQFKLDGTGSPDKVTPGSAFDSDFDAARALIADLRAASPGLYINLTTGTWPSPFWLASADSIWRGGEDHGFLGSGRDRQRWITYRDADTYGGIVRQGPWFPLNALMLHGIIYARHARGLDRDPGHDLADEAWSYFASGTGLQELYVSADLLAPGDWDVIAAAARWARERASILRDSHWVGGDPARGEVYGWASWAPTGAVLALRNPSSTPRRITIDPSVVFELPRDAAHRFRIVPRHGASPTGSRLLDRPRTILLAPYAVLVWDLAPER